MKKLLLFAFLGVLLCSTSLFGQQVLPPVKHLLHIDTRDWDSDLVAVSHADNSIVTIDDCTYTEILPGTRYVPLNNKESLRIKNFAINLICVGPIFGTGVADLPVSDTVKVWTEATFKDRNGNFNYVIIPPLPDALPVSNATYTFTGIENDSCPTWQPDCDYKNTFIAFIGNGVANLHLKVFNSKNVKLADEYIDFNTFAFYELRTKVDIGYVVVTNEPFQIGPAPTPTPIYAVAFVGFHNGGGPRVELPVKE